MNSAGMMIVARTIGSRHSLIIASSGSLAGLSIRITFGPSWVWATISYVTLGAVWMRSTFSSRSRRSWTISMCSRPRKPQRNPNPSASLVSACHLKLESLRLSRSRAFLRSS